MGSIFRVLGFVAMLGVGLLAAAAATGAGVNVLASTSTTNDGGGGNSDASCTFVANANGSVSVTCDKALSHYTVTLCSGSLGKVDVGGEHTTWTFGPYASPIVSVEV